MAKRFSFETLAELWLIVLDAERLQKFSVGLLRILKKSGKSWNLK